MEILRLFTLEKIDWDISSGQRFNFKENSEDIKTHSYNHVTNNIFYKHFWLRRDRGEIDFGSALLTQGSAADLCRCHLSGLLFV